MEGERREEDAFGTDVSGVVDKGREDQVGREGCGCGS